MSKEDTIYFKGRRDKDGELSQDSEEYRRWKAGGKTDIVHLCPRGCKGSLIEKDEFLTCNGCDGLKISVDNMAEGTRSGLERMTGEHRVRDALLQFIRMGKESDLNCALCNKKMSEIELQYDPNQVADFQFIFGRGLGHGGDHPILLLIEATLISIEVVNATRHITKKIAAGMKKKVTRTMTLDGCLSCESMWFDGKKYCSPSGSYNHEIELINRFWTSTKKSAAINRLDEKKAEDDAVKLLEKEKEKERKEREKERKKREAKKKEEARRAALTPEQRQAEDEILRDNRPYWQRYDDL